MDQWQIVEELSPSRAQELDMAEIQSLGFPKRYVEIASHIGIQEIASDYVLPTSMHLAVENLRVASHAKGWRVFAVSASGDMWLVRASDAEDDTAFLPQDDDNSALPQPLGIKLFEWFEMALYIRKYERAVANARSEAEKRQLKAKAKAFLETLAKGLTQRYPYAL